MDWDDLRFFLVLARERTLTDAARRLGVRPSTVQRRIGQLEHTLGTRLFVRTARGHRVTEAAQELLVHAEEVATTLARAEEELRGRDDRSRGRVRITTTELGAELVLLDALPTWVERWPELQLELDVSPQVVDLASDEETLALRFGRPTGPDLIARRLGQVTFRLYGPRDVGVIGWSRPYAAAELSRWIDRNPVRLRLPSLRAHAGAARLGLGAAGLPTFPNPLLEGLDPIDGPELTLEVWLAVPRARRRLARVAAAARFVEEAFRARAGA